MAAHQRSYAEVTSGFKIAIVPGAYPQEKLTLKQSGLINDAVLNRINDQLEGEFVPHFVDSKLAEGALVVTGERKLDTEWLEKMMAGEP